MPKNFQYIDSNFQDKGGFLMASPTPVKKTFLAMGLAPRLARWLVFCLQSIQPACCARHNATKAASDILDPSAWALNIYSPNTARPIDTQ